MISLYSYLLTFLAIAYWIFRVIVTILFDFGKEFFAYPINETIEIAVIFATLPCIVLILKRNIIGAALYLGIYAAYFGTALYESIANVAGSSLKISDASNIFAIVVGIVIAALVFIDVLINKNRSIGKNKGNTNWFYNNSDYDREFDERADRNQYRL